MAHRTVVERVSEALADATGRTEEEVKVAVAVTAVSATVLGVLRLLSYLSDLGTDVLDRARN